MTDRPCPLVALLALSFLLAACGGTPADDPGPTPLASVSGRVVAPGSALLGTGLLLAEESAFSPGGAGLASVVAAGDGLYAGPVTAVVDEEFTLLLPEAADLPAAVLALAGDALYNAGTVADCRVVADVPTAALTTFAVGYGTVPGAYAVSAAVGLKVAFVSDAALDFEALTIAELLGGRTLYAWVHASEAVALTIEGAGCAGATPAGIAGGVALEPGWNQVAWDLNADATVATLRNDDGEVDLVISVPDDL